MTSRGQCLPETGLTHMNSETMTACTTLHSLKPNKILAPRKRNRHKVRPFTKSYLQLIPTGKVKSHFFFLKDYHWVYQPHSIADPIFRCNWPIQNGCFPLLFVLVYFNLHFLFLRVFYEVEAVGRWRGFGRSLGEKIGSKYIYEKKQLKFKIFTNWPLRRL